MNSRVAALFAAYPAVAIRSHPSLRSTLWRLVRCGELTSPLPGVVVRSEDADPFTRLASVALWSQPKGVIHSTTAGQIWLGQRMDGPIRLAHPSLRSREDVVVSRHLVPEEFVVTAKQVRLAAGAYVAAELADRDRGRTLSECLREGLASQADAQSALGCFRRAPGQSERRRTMRNCQSTPWSFAEVRLHKILWDAGVTGWSANTAIRLSGQVFHPDVLFEDEKLVIEFDGKASHQAAGQFLRDRERQNLLVLAGYRVLRFTWEHLDEPGYVVAMVVEARNETPPQRLAPQRPADESSLLAQMVAGRSVARGF